MNNIYSPCLKSSESNYFNLGCWEDKSSRSIPELCNPNCRFKCDHPSYSKRNDAINKCFECARNHGFSVFALQDGGQCVGGNDVESYKKYGRSDACKSGGKGGPYANQVYGINRK